MIDFDGYLRLFVVCLLFHAGSPENVETQPLSMNVDPKKLLLFLKLTFCLLALHVIAMTYLNQCSMYQQHDHPHPHFQLFLKIHFVVSIISIPNYTNYMQPVFPTCYKKINVCKLRVTYNHYYLTKHFSLFTQEHHLIS